MIPIYEFNDRLSLKPYGLSENNEVISQTSVLLTESIRFFQKKYYTPIFVQIFWPKTDLFTSK